MGREIAAVLFVTCCPELEFREGMFHVFFDAGARARFEIVLTPATFLESLRDANGLAEQFHRRAAPIELARH